MCLDKIETALYALKTLHKKNHIEISTVQKKPFIYAIKQQRHQFIRKYEI